MAEGIATSIAQEGEHHARVHGLATDEHVVPPDEEAQHGDGDAGKGHEVIAEDALPAKQVISSLITPMAGKIMMYTAGCE